MVRALACACACLGTGAADAAQITQITDAELAAMAVEKAFVAEARMGNRSARNGDWELGLWSPERVADQADFGWASGEAVDFALTWDAGVEEVRFSLGRGADRRTVQAAELDLVGGLAVRLASYREGSTGVLDTLMLNGVAIDQPLQVVGGTAMWLVGDTALQDGFTLSGRATFAWAPGDAPRGSQSAFQVKALVADQPPAVAVPTPTAASLALAALGGLALRRPRASEPG